MDGLCKESVAGEKMIFGVVSSCAGTSKVHSCGDSQPHESPFLYGESAASGKVAACAKL